VIGLAIMFLVWVLVFSLMSIAPMREG